MKSPRAVCILLIERGFFLCFFLFWSIIDMCWKMVTSGGKRATTPYRFPAHDVTQVDHDVYVGGPGVELPLPGGERGQRHHHQEGPVELMLVEQVGQERDGLDGLSQTHLVGQDDAVAPEDEEEEITSGAAPSTPS